MLQSKKRRESDGRFGYTLDMCHKMQARKSLRLCESVGGVCVGCVDMEEKASCVRQEATTCLVIRLAS